MKGKAERHVKGCKALFLGRESEDLRRILSEPNGAGIPALEVVFEEDLQKAFRRASKEPVELILLDLDQGEWNLATQLPLIRRAVPEATLIVLTSGEKETEARQSLEHGAHDFLVTHEVTPPLLSNTAKHFAERRRLEMELARKDEDFERLTLRYQAVLRSTPNGLCMITPEWIIQWGNPTLSHILNPSRNDTIDLSGVALASLFPTAEDFEAYRATAPRRMGLQGIDVREIQLRRFDGTRFFAELSIVRLDPTQTAPGYVLTVCDKTEQRSAWDELKWLSGVMEQTADAVFVTDRDGVILYVNPAFESMTGYVEAEAVGQPVGRILNSGVQGSGFYEDLWSAIRAGKVFRSLFVNRKKSGELYDVDETITPVMTEDGEIVHFISTSRDITERKRAEETLQRSERRFSQVFHTAPLPVGISTVDEGRYLDVNDSFLELTGFSREEVIGRTSVELGLWLSEDQRKEFIREARERGRLENHPLDVRVRSGEIRHGLASVDFVEIEGEKHLLLIFLDITELRLTEHALRESEARNRAILNAIPDTMLLMTHDGTYLDYHTQHPEDLVFPPEKFLFRRQKDILPEELLRKYEAIFEEVIRTGRLQVMEYSIDHGGRTMHLEIRIAPCGENQLLKIVRNITEEKNLREQVLSNERLAAVGQTAAIAAHGMKNIFTALKGSISLLDRAIDSENALAARQAHHLLDKSTTRLYMLFMEMLDYSKQRTPNVRPIGLLPLLNEVADLMRLIDHKEVGIECEVGEGAETAVLDREWIFRALVNLGSNALDAVPYGGNIRLRTFRIEPPQVEKEGEESETRGANGEVFPELVIAVEDNGCGIAEPHLPHIFRPLFTTKESRGTGLGLACVKQFVECMGGRIELTTAVNKGCAFHLIFPVYPNKYVS